MWGPKVYESASYCNICFEETCLRVTIHSQNLRQQLMLIRVVDVAGERLLYLYIYYCFWLQKYNKLLFRGYIMFYCVSGTTTSWNFPYIQVNPWYKENHGLEWLFMTGLTFWHYVWNEFQASDLNTLTFMHAGAYVKGRIWLIKGIQLKSFYFRNSGCVPTIFLFQQILWLPSRLVTIYTSYFMIECVWND